MASRQEVADFLGQFKIAMDLGFFSFVSREKNIQGLADLGITMNDAKHVLASLTPADYSYGPEADRDGPEEEVWFFGRDVQGTEAYIKLKLTQDTRRRTVVWAKVLGFHPAERAITYPLREAES